MPPCRGLRLCLIIKLCSVLFCSVKSRPGIKRTDNSGFYSDLEFVRLIYFATNVKKRSENQPFFGKVPELKYSGSLKMVTKLHNLSKQSQIVNTPGVTWSFVYNRPIINYLMIVN